MDLVAIYPEALGYGNQRSLWESLRQQLPTDTEDKNNQEEMI
jgi:hypothetical protein